MSKDADQNPRYLALKTLLRIEETDGYSNLSLDAALKESALSPQDRRLFTVLVYGVIERKLTLDHLILDLADRPLEKIDEKAKMILRLGIYQLRYLDRIPPHAAVSESVNLAPRRLAGFINACLREYLRRGDKIPFPDKDKDPARYLSVRYSVSYSLSEAFLTEFGVERAESLLGAYEKQPPLSLTVNRLSAGNRESYLAALRLSDIDYEIAPYSESGVSILSPLPVEELPGYADGAFFVQDEASRICVEALDPRPGDVVIDACSCPGSKSFGAAIRMENVGEIHSFDLHKNKLSLVKRGAERLKLSIITPEAKDGKHYDPTLHCSADRVLCDVPCSCFGILHKKPDIRYKDVSVTERLPEIQYAILENNARYVKPGGVLVYATCTIFSAENWYNVQKFLAVHPEFSPEDFSIGDLHSENGMLTLYPDVHGTDGFFIAKLRRYDGEIFSEPYVAPFEASVSADDTPSETI